MGIIQKLLRIANFRRTVLTTIGKIKVFIIIYLRSLSFFLFS